MVVVGICTHQRPAELSRLLRHLFALPVIQEGRARVLIVDNNPDGSARQTVAPWDVAYAHEPRAGLPHARNRVLTEARLLGATWLAFLDDDEVPTEGWLDALLATQQRYNADVVSGPSVPTLPGHLEWARAYLVNPRQPTGTPLHFWATNNVLLRLAALEVVGEFDGRYLHGGEDTQYSVRCRLAGLRMVWCDEAVVHEPTDERRANPKWLIARSRLAGRIMTQVERDLQVGQPLRRRANGLARVALGAAALLPARLLGRGLRVQVFMARGQGMLER